MFLSATAIFLKRYVHDCSSLFSSNLFSKMAQSSSNTNTGVLRELINRVTELSHAISPPNTSTEINNIFNRRQGPQLEQQSVASQSQVAETQATSSRQDSLPIRRNASSTPTTAFSTRRFFPAARPPLWRNKKRNNVLQGVDHRPFMQDLILLSGPNENLVPRQGSRLVLMENGHILTGCRFTKDLSAVAVETNIVQAFEGKIPPNVDIEILTSIHSNLVAPSLAPGQLLDGVMLHRIFKQKPVYVRPSCNLLNTRSSNCSMQVFPGLHVLWS